MSTFAYTCAHFSFSAIVTRSFKTKAKTTKGSIIMFDQLLRTTSATERNVFTVCALLAVVFTIVHFVYGVAFSGASLFMVLSYLTIIVLLLSYIGRVERINHK